LIEDKSAAPEIKFEHEVFDVGARTFETRLLYLRSIYEDKNSNLEIMQRCIEHKLDRNLLNYLQQLETNYRKLMYASKYKRKTILNQIKSRKDF
jgi:hypothetical protein